MGKQALTWAKSDGVVTVSHRGYTWRGLLRFHGSLCVSAVLLAVAILAQPSPLLNQISLAVALVLLLYAIAGYSIYLPFAGFGGRVRLAPKTESLSYDRTYLSLVSVRHRQIPWEGRLETEVERVGVRANLLPLHYFRVKVVTDFMTYHVATFGPGFGAAAFELAQAIKRARYGRAQCGAKGTSSPYEQIRPGL